VVEGVELRELKVFLALAEELHFGRTATRLGLTQSRVSQSLRSLERKLGDQLVHRTSRRVTLTPPGERFRAQLAPALEQLSGVLERAATRQLSGTVRIGARYPNTGGERLVRIIDEFEARHPDCRVQITPTPPDDPGGALRHGDVDFIATPLLGEPTFTVLVATLATEPRVLAVARDHPLTRRTRIELEDLGDYRVAATSILPDEQQEAWIPLRTPSGRPIERLQPPAATDNELAMLVARGKAVVPIVETTSTYFAPPNIVCIPIVGLPPIRIALLTMPGPWDPRRRELIRVAREIVGESPPQTKPMPPAGPGGR
jgi:DNA-binding transcriptional LysR family regulator